MVVRPGLFLCARCAGEPFSATSVLTLLIAFFGGGALPDRWLVVRALLVALAVSPIAVDPRTLNSWVAVALSTLGMPWLLGAFWLRAEFVTPRSHSGAAASEDPENGDGEWPGGGPVASADQVQDPVSAQGVGVVLDPGGGGFGGAEGR